MRINISAGRHKFLTESVANLTLKADSAIEAKKLKVQADAMTLRIQGGDLFTLYTQLMYAFQTAGVMSTADKQTLVQLATKYEPAFSQYLGLPPEEPAARKILRPRAKKKPTKQKE